MASELLERDMYNGVYHLTHNPEAKGRQPRYVVSMNDGEATEQWKPLGVTTIQGKVLAKDFVSWALDCMEQELQDKLRIEGEVSASDIADAKKASANKRDAGANTGSLTHLAVEQYLKGDKVELGEMTPEVSKAYGSFVKWFEDVAPTVVNVEEPIYSQSYDYAGCYDAMLEIDGKELGWNTPRVVLTDLKTTNASRKAPRGIYAEYFTQLGGYAWAHEEQRRYEEQHGGTKLRKIDDLGVLSAKKDGKFDAVYASELGLQVDDCMNHFKMVVQLYRFLNLTTNKLGGKM